MFRIGLALTLALFATGSLHAASPDPKLLAVPPAELAKAQELVRSLGSDDYLEREDAMKSLARMGRMALPALADAANTNPSAEVRSRAARLLPRAEAEELKARLETFLADEELQYEHELPGWAEFRVAAGAEWRFFGATLWKDTRVLKTARTVYIELLDAPSNRSLIFAVGSSPTDLGAAVGTRRVELYNVRLPGRPGGFNGGPRSITAPDVVTLLFAESQVSARHIPITRVVSINILLTPLNFTGSDDRSAIYRNVAARWMESRDDSASQYQAMLAARSLSMPASGTKIALKLLADTKGTPMYRAQAMVSLVNYDARDSIPALEQAMTDTTIVYSPAGALNVAQPYEPILVRDVALVAAVVLSRQRPEDYGFIQRVNYGNTGLTMSSYMQWAVPAGGWGDTFIRRSLALAKWQQWREQNLGEKKDETVK
jgi:hypothetical protein